MEKLPLGLIESGQSAIIKDIRGNQHLRQQLLEQGLVDGCHVKVVKNDTGGPQIISINDTRLALGRGVALQISAEVVTGS
jgi:ferrous iron transport protein A